MTNRVKLLEQPGDGVESLVQAMDRAKHRIEMAIFRFDRSELETAMVRAVNRGVFVHALIAYTNRGGEKSLRALEMRLLEHGVNVARTAGDLVRYHGKYMIVDRRELYVLGFNFTYLDTEHSRSFGLITRNRLLVKEAVKLFEADTKRQAYESGSRQFIVSPVNARAELMSFIAGARKELVLYDPKISDPRMLRLLEDRQSAGVHIRIIGKVDGSEKLSSRELYNMRLHIRGMVRDGKQVFLGSQSLRTAELETRREVGIIVSGREIAGRILKTFDADWKTAGEHLEDQPVPRTKAVRKIAKAVAKSLPPMGSVLEDLVRNEAGEDGPAGFDAARLEEAVKVAVKQAVEQSVLAVVEEVTELSRES